MATITRLAARIAHWTDTYFSASDVVWAIRENRRPDPDDLRRLGIDPRAYLRIGHG